MFHTQLEDATAVLEWLTHNKGYWDDANLELRPSSLGGIGVFAKNDLLPHTTLQPKVLLRLHKSSVLSSERSMIANLLTEANIDGALGLVIAFIYEKDQGKSSPWYQFIKSIKYQNDEGELMLPPSMWTSKEKTILQGTELEVMGALDDQENQDAYETACTFALNQNELSHGTISVPWELNIEGKEPEHVLNTYRSFIAISHAITSRNFEVDDYHQTALVPGACLFNHSNRPTVKFESLFDVCAACGSANGCDHDVQINTDDEGEGEDEDLDENDGDDGDENDEDSHDEDSHDEDSHDEDNHDESNHDTDIHGKTDEQGLSENIENAHDDDKENGQDELEEIEDEDEEELDHTSSCSKSCCSNSSLEDLSNSESEEEFDGPIEKFIEEIEAGLAREQELNKILNSSTDHDGSNSDAEDRVIIMDDDKAISSDDCCDIVLRKKVKKGEELFNNYGDFSNSVLLSRYGFVIPQNTNETVGLGIQFLRLLKNNKKLYSRHFDWWEKMGHLIMSEYLFSTKSHCEKATSQDDCGSECYSDEECDDSRLNDIPNWTLDVSVGFNGEPTPITYAFLRLLSLSKFELVKFLQKSSKVNAKLLMTKNKGAYMIYKKLVLARTKEYNNEIDFNKLLKSPNQRERKAAQLVMDERNVLKRALEVIGKRL